jgi:hypothetical protein
MHIHFYSVQSFLYRLDKKSAGLAIGLLFFIWEELFYGCREDPIAGRPSRTARYALGVMPVYFLNISVKLPGEYQLWPRFMRRGRA